MSTLFEKTLKRLGMPLLLVLAAMFVGCSSDDNPMDSGDPDPQPTIRTPKALIVQSIRVLEFNSKKTRRAAGTPPETGGSRNGAVFCRTNDRTL